MLTSAPPTDATGILSGITYRGRPFRDERRREWWRRNARPVDQTPRRTKAVAIITQRAPEALPASCCRCPARSSQSGAVAVKCPISTRFGGLSPRRRGSAYGSRAAALTTSADGPSGAFSPFRASRRRSPRPTDSGPSAGVPGAILRAPSGSSSPQRCEIDQDPHTEQTWPTMIA